MALSTTGDVLLRAKERAENFPVALRVLPRRVRRHLVAVYDVVRVIDDLGDEATGDRTAQLEAFAQDLAQVWDGGERGGGWGIGKEPQAEVLRRLVPTVRATGLPRELFDRMVAANLQDQRVREYPTYADLRQYCTLSADPVGRMVLGVFGVTSDTAGELSDRVCTALQLVEHWQDVAEDRAKGRVYLPKEDLIQYGVSPSDLDGGSATPALRRLMAFETERAAALLDSGAPLVGQLHGWARLAVAGYVAGGRAAVDALRRSGGEVLAGPPRARNRDVLRHLLRLLLTGGRR
jgi:squalene synthase HpnC